LKAEYFFPEWFSDKKNMVQSNGYNQMNYHLVVSQINIEITVIPIEKEL